METRRNGIPALVQTIENNKKYYLDFKGESYTLGLTNNNDYKARYFLAFSSLKSPTTVFPKIYIQKKKKIWNQKF